MSDERTRSASVAAISDDEAIHLVHSMVSIPSLSRDERGLARFLTGELVSRGFEAEIDEAGNACGVAGEGPLSVALVGHMDTVPGDLPVVLKDGILHGRGAVDAKGCLAAFVVAASRVVNAGLPLRVRVVGCVEEEAPSSKGARALAREAAPDLLVVGEPSGWDGVTLGYKGYLRASLSLEGDNAHTAHDEQTIPDRACDVWMAVKTAAESFNAERPRAFERVLPALLEVTTENDGARARARLDLSLRLPPDLSPAQAEDFLRAAAPDVSVELAAPPMPAWSGPRTTPLARAFGRAILARDARPRFQVKTGTADLNLLAPAWGCPALAYGPGDAALDHTPNEHLVLDEYLEAIAVLVDVLTTCAGGAPPQNAKHPFGAKRRRGAIVRASST